MILILKGMFVLIILVAMAMILLGINRLFTNDFAEEEELNILREEVKATEQVMTRQNIFRKFLGR